MGPSTLEIRDPLPHWALRPPKKGGRDRQGYSYTSSYGGPPRVDSKVRGHLPASRQEYRTLLNSLDGRSPRSVCAVRGIPFSPEIVIRFRYAAAVFRYAVTGKRHPRDIGKPQLLTKRSKRRAMRGRVTPARAPLRMRHLQQRSALGARWAIPGAIPVVLVPGPTPGFDALCTQSPTPCSGM